MIDLKRLEFNTSADFKSFNVEGLLTKLASESFITLEAFDEWHKTKCGSNRYQAKKTELTNSICRLMKYVLGCAIKCNINIEEAFSAYTEEVEGDWVEQDCQ